MKVAVVGAGTMGAGIAQACAVAGHEVALQDVNEGARTRGLGAVDTSLARFVKKGTLTDEAKAEGAGAHYADGRPRVPPRGRNHHRGGV